MLPDKLKGVLKVSKNGNFEFSRNHAVQEYLLEIRLAFKKIDVILRKIL